MYSHLIEIISISFLLLPSLDRPKQREGDRNSRRVYICAMIHLYLNLCARLNDVILLLFYGALITCLLFIPY